MGEADAEAEGHDQGHGHEHAHEELETALAVPGLSRNGAQCEVMRSGMDVRRRS